jgi:hypothetical protein
MPALLPTGSFNLRGLVRAVLDYVRRIEAAEGTVKVDPTTQQPVGYGGKITLREPDAAGREAGLVSADALLASANEALRRAGLKSWLLLDRLDVAFAESEQLEQNALRALFRVYLEMAEFPRISLKIFLRSDIWKRITQIGFREASHITSSVKIEWNNQSLLNLVVRRAVQNEALRRFYDPDPDSVLADAHEQEKLFYRIFPQQIEAGTRKPTTLDWMLSRTKDGTGQTAPRELIHLLSCARDVQLRKLEMGHDEPPAEALFDPISLKEALPEVSEVRLEQTLYAEFSRLKAWLVKLDGEKTQHTADTLAKIWGVGNDQAHEVANELTEIGFFEKQGEKDSPVFWVPFLYRPALHLVQGSAE